MLAIKSPDRCTFKYWNYGNWSIGIMYIVLIPRELKEHLLLKHFLETLWQSLELSSGHCKAELGRSCPVLGRAGTVHCSGMLTRPLLRSSVTRCCPGPPLTCSVLLRIRNRVRLPSGRCPFQGHTWQVDLVLNFCPLSLSVRSLCCPAALRCHASNNRHKGLQMSKAS